MKDSKDYITTFWMSNVFLMSYKSMYKGGSKWWSDTLRKKPEIMGQFQIRYFLVLGCLWKVSKEKNKTTRDISFA